MGAARSYSKPGFPNVHIARNLLDQLSGTVDSVGKAGSPRRLS